MSPERKSTSQSRASRTAARDSFPIAGIGASAGGLEAFTLLLHELAARIWTRLERAGAEEALRASEEQFASIFNQSTGGIAQTDLTGQFTLVNDRFCQIVERSRAELLGLRMQDITHPEDLPGNLERFQALAAGHGSNFVIEKRYVRPDGSTVWVHNDVAAIRDAAGNVRNITAAVTDIDYVKQGEIELQAAVAREKGGARYGGRS